jgi:isochorismate synthase
MTLAQRGLGADEAVGAALLERLTRALDDASGHEPGTLVSVTISVPAIDPIAVYAAARPAGASLWLQPAAGFGLVGIGSAWSIEARGPTRFSEVSAAWRALLEGAVLDVDGSPRGSGPTLLGGFSFDDEASTSGTWAAFAPASLQLPQLLLTTTPQGAWLSVCQLSQQGGEGESQARRSVEAWSTIATAARLPIGDPPDATLRVTERRPEAPAWYDSVARLAGAVGRGRLDKAVLSREVSLAGPRAIDIPAVLRRLEGSAADSTLFALSRGAGTFVGATPERLVRLQDRVLKTMAMAGSTARGTNADEDDALASALLRSDKEREEHSVVVTMLREALAPLAEGLDIPAAPTVKRFRHVQHLVTPVEGVLAEDTDILALVERLHPTPAVGGAPRTLALELIADEEPHDRGWYAGPLGWVDGHGEGEFVVGLRSGLICGEQATLFAGCGIVADSDPAREWRESSTKLLALGSALGHLEP